MMFNHPMSSVMRPNPKAPTMHGGGRQQTSKARYSQIYERALKDKIATHLQQQKQSCGNQHTPSSASFNMSISTLELIEFVLHEYEQNNSVMNPPAATTTQKKQSYTVYEDLKIIKQLGKEEGQITNSSFKRLADQGYVGRTHESIKSRYSDYLKNLNKEDYQNILSFVELHSLKGYLVFEKNDKGINMLQRIQKTDPRNEQQNSNGVTTPRSPQRSPLGTATTKKAVAGSERLDSPGLFSMPAQKQMSPISGSGFMPPFMYPQFPMFPPDTRMPLYNNKQFADPSQQMYPMNMFMNPFMQMGMQGYPPMMPPQYRKLMMQQNGISSNEEQNIEFEIRPSQKKSVVKATNVASAFDADDELSSAETRKKIKGNNEDNRSSNLQKSEQKQNGGGKVQTTLIFSKPILNAPKAFQTQSKDSEVRKSLSLPRTLSKEVYDLISEEDKIPEEEFQEMLNYISEQVKLPKEQVVDILNALSGSFKDFAVYMDTKQENMLWNAEEDKILAQITKEDSPEFKLLTKLKGLPSIKKRILYCNLKFPFQIA